MGNYWLNVGFSILVLLAGLGFDYGCYLLQKDAYWRRKWEEAGCPAVATVEELKDLLGIKSNKWAKAKK